MCSKCKCWINFKNCNLNKGYRSHFKIDQPKDKNMKKIFSLFILLTPALAHADSKTDYQFNPAQLILNASVVAILYISGTFIVSLIKMRLDGRFRDKLIDSGRSDEMITQLLRPIEKEKRDEAFRAMVIFGGIAIGLALASAAPSMGVLSIAIMGFCLALSFLAYYLYLRYKPKGPIDPQ